MGWWGNLAERWAARGAGPTAEFTQPAGPIDAAVMAGKLPDAPVSRAEALSVSAVTKGRNKICGSIATLPLYQANPANERINSPLLRQFDPNVPNPVHLAMTIEDLLFDSISWWEVIAQDAAGWPTYVRRREPGSVSVEPPKGRTQSLLPSGLDPREGVVWVDGRPVPFSKIIRFDSPNPPILRVGARTIRRAIALDESAKLHALNPVPGEYFTDAPGVAQAAPNAVRRHLAAWRWARQHGTVAYVPPAYVYNTVPSVSPRDLQLVELQNQVGIELANFFNLDPEDMGISTTSRTYANVNDRRIDKINETYGPYMAAVTGRLSMPDVTPRGHEVRFDLSEFLKPNPTERAAVQRAYIDMNVYDNAYVRNVLEKIPGPPPAKPEPPAPAPAEAPPATDPATPKDAPPVDNSREPMHTFTAATVTFVAPCSEEFSVDTEARTITGVMVPWNRSAKGVRFERGALQFSNPTRVKLNIDHNRSALIGVLTEATDKPAGMVGKVRVATGPEGDRALALASEGILDGFSVEVDWAPTDVVPDPRNRDGVLVRRADWRGVALTGQPAFDDARVTRVNMSEGDAMRCTVCGMEHAAGVQCTPTATPPAPPAATTPVTMPERNFSAAEVQAMLAHVGAPYAHLGINTPAAQAAREVVNPTATVAVTTVTEPPSYVFDRDHYLHAAAHDFGMDLVKAARSGREDSPEYRRVMEFVTAQFDIATANVTALNPTQTINRFIDQREYAYPLWNAINRGAPPNGIQGFNWPVFSSASGLVANHTEGTEPTSGAYAVAASATVTPTPTSGKAKIRREVWDMGGMPGISGILWARIERDWYEALEAFAVAGLGTAAPASLGTFTAGGGANKATLVAEMKAYLAGLQFVRGGNRFDLAFAQADLYGALSSATDTTGRPMFPQISPMNADGTVAGRWTRLDIGGVPFVPEWALAAAGQVNATPSYLIDSTAVDGWATPPQRIDIINTEVANVYVGVWGYKAFAVNDAAGARTISYDPV